MKVKLLTAMKQNFDTDLALDTIENLGERLNVKAVVLMT